MKICLVPVCYNAHDDAVRFLDSVNTAFSFCLGVELEVILSDNSTLSSVITFDARNYSYNFRYLQNSNIGYFPAFARALSTLTEPIDSYDFVMVCNVDLVVSKDFFIALSSVSPGKDVGLIAPGIFSDKDGRDLNPKIMRRPSLRKMKFMRMVCSSTALFRWYSMLVRARERTRACTQRKIAKKGGAIGGQPAMYGAHGSFIIFTQLYFKRGAHVLYPRFLFGEEVFVAEQLRLNNMLIQHVPDVRMSDKEHASTSKIKLKFICPEHRKSYEYWLSKFFDD